MIFFLFWSLIFCQALCAEDLNNNQKRTTWHFVDMKRQIHKKDPSVLVVLPVIVKEGDEEFAEEAFEQISEFFRGYNWMVPSKIRISIWLEQEQITPDQYEKKFTKIAKDFKSDLVVLLKIQKATHTTKINPAGVLAAGATISGVSRYARSELILSVFNPQTKVTDTRSAVEYKRDHVLGFWQSSRRMIRKVQRETLKGLLVDFATSKIHRSTGYILEPIHKAYEDAKGFQ